MNGSKDDSVNGDAGADPRSITDIHATKSELRNTLSHVSTWKLATLLWLAFAILYTLLRSLDFTAVDGAVRAAEVLHRGELFFHGNNHLLYPFNVWVWNGALALFGLGSEDPIGYIRDTQLMNALAGAGCVAIVFAIGAKLGEAKVPALVAALIFGFSRVAFLQFSNSAEPTVGLFWSLAAIGVLVVGLERGSEWLMVLSGALLALALATYQSMLLIGGIAVALCLLWNLPASLNWRVLLNTSRRIAWFTIGGLISTVIVFGGAYAHEGVPGFAPKIGRFVEVVGSGTFGGFASSKFVNLPVGFVASLLPVLPPDYFGLRSLIARPDAVARVLLLCGSSLSLFVIVLRVAIEAARRASFQSPPRFRGGVAMLGGLAIAMFPLVYWAPLYDKLWLQPLAIMAILVPLGLKGKVDKRLPDDLRIAGTALLLVVALSNLSWAVPASRVQPVEVGSAQAVMNIVQPNDLLICDWDGVSSIVKALADSRYDVIDLPSTAVEFKADAASVIAGRVRIAEARGGRIYFLGVLDQSPETWRLFLGDKNSLPYESFDNYRRSARVVRGLQTNGGQVSLWLVDGPGKSDSASQSEPKR